MKPGITPEKALFILESAQSAIQVAVGQGLSSDKIKAVGLAVVEALIAVDSAIQKALDSAD